MHGRTQGKLYTFRPDCDECLVEAWERMTFGGVGFNTDEEHLREQGYFIHPERCGDEIVFPPYWSGVLRIHVRGGFDAAR
jgi:hypothetical protein